MYSIIKIIQLKVTSVVGVSQTDEARLTEHATPRLYIVSVNVFYLARHTIIYKGLLLQ